MSAASPSPTTEPGVFGRTFHAFGFPQFRLMWTGAFTSTTGSFVQEVAQSWLVYQLTSDPFLLGLTVLLNNAPILMFSLLGGVAADRMDRRFLLLASQLVQMTSALTLAALIWTDRIEIWHILAAALFTGLGQAFGGPAYQALIPSLVSKPVVPNAVALMSIQFHLANAVGRTIGGVAFEALGAGWCFAINGLSFLAVIGSLLMLPKSFIPNKEQGKVWASLREGVGYVYHSRVMFALVALAVATAFLGFPVMTLLPVFARDIYNLDAAGYSYLGAMFGVGGVAGALLVAWLGNRERKGRRVLLMQIALGAVTFGFGLAANAWLAGGFLLLLGVAALAVAASIQSLAQLLAPEEMRGRILSVYHTAFRGSMAVGPAVAGYLSRFLGAPAVVMINGALLVAVAAAFLFRSQRLREL